MMRHSPTRITLNVDVAEARDLLDRVPRSCLNLLKVVILQLT